MTLLALFNDLFAKPDTRQAEMIEARQDHARIKALWIARCDAGDTRGMGEIWPDLARANQRLLRAEAALREGRDAA